MSDDPSSQSPAPQPRIGSGELTTDLAKKFRKVRVRKPIYRRRWFRRALWIGGSVFLVAAICIGVIVMRWHRKQLNELGRQRAAIEGFVRSPQFEEFGRTIDAHTIALINYLSVRPAGIREVFPQISARENQQRLLPWTAELTPMPNSAAQEPGRAAAARQHLLELLTARGLELNADQMEEGRRLFIRALVPHAQAFINGAPRRSFPAFHIDRSLQDVTINAFAARDGSSPAQTEQFFAVYAILGPEFWKAIEQSRGKLPVRVPASFEKSP